MQLSLGDLAKLPFSQMCQRLELVKLQDQVKNMHKVNEAKSAAAECRDLSKLYAARDSDHEFQQSYGHEVTERCPLTLTGVLIWRCVGEEQPSGGRELRNAERLATGLTQKTSFTKQEWRDFQVLEEMRMEHFVKSGTLYYQPVAVEYEHVSYTVQPIALRQLAEAMGCRLDDPQVGKALDSYDGDDDALQSELRHIARFRALQSHGFDGTKEQTYRPPPPPPPGVGLAPRLRPDRGPVVAACANASDTTCASNAFVLSCPERINGSSEMTASSSNAGSSSNGMPSGPVPVVAHTTAKPSPSLADGVTPLALTTVVPLSPAAPVAAATTDGPHTAMILAPPDIGTDAWKELPEADRHKSLQALLDTCGLHGFSTSGVRALAKHYLRKIAPLERLPAKRGYSYRGQRYAGKPLQDAWTDLLSKEIEPLLCGVVEYMDNEKVSFWAACDAIEEKRQDVGDFGKLIKQELSKFKGKEEARKPYIQRLLDAELASKVLDELVTPIVEEETETVSEVTEETEDAVVVPLVMVPTPEGAVTRILSLDPALCCGWAVVQLDESGEILSNNVGVFEVDKSLTSDGARCNNLKQQLRPLLTPQPDHAFIEPFFAHGRQGDPISFKLRGAIETELDDASIASTEVTPQSWKASIAGSGVCTTADKVAKASAEASGASESSVKAAVSLAEKVAVMDAIQRTSGFSFPDKLFVNGKWSVDKKRMLDAVRSTESNTVSPLPPLLHLIPTVSWLVSLTRRLSHCTA